MGTTEVTKQEAGDGTGASRRTVVKGFAWSVPVVAAAIAAPTSSASGCGSNAGAFGTTNPGVHDQWIPKCATRVRYIVRGGGGATFAIDSPLMGAAAEATGEFALPATWQGGWLKLIVGAGGEAVDHGLAKGGIGFGRGGNGTDTSANDGDDGWSCGGGGGSAITFEGALLVAAGGGGGSPIAVLKSTEDGTRLVDKIAYWDTHAASGFPFGRDNATYPNGVGLGLRKPGTDAAGALVAPARGGVNGGAGVSGTWVTPANDNFVKAASFAGDDGGVLGSGFNGGGNGGSAATSQNNYTLPGETDALINTPAGGGGGGGHRGGGGGGFAFFRETFSGFDKRAVAAASGGGAGSSFVATRVAGIAVTGDVGMFTEASGGRAGHQGRVWVSWS